MPSVDEVFNRHMKLFEKLAEISSSASAIGVVDDTPKFSGQARASVNYSIGKINKNVVIVANYQKNAIIGTRSTARSLFKNTSKKLKLGQTVFITSSISYAATIEYVYGYRPFGKAIQSWEQLVNEVVLKIGSN